MGSARWRDIQKLVLPTSNLHGGHNWKRPVLWVYCEEYIMSLGRISKTGSFPVHFSCETRQKNSNLMGIRLGIDYVIWNDCQKWIPPRSNPYAGQCDTEGVEEMIPKDRFYCSQWFILLNTSLLSPMVLMMKTSLLFEICD